MGLSSPLGSRGNSRGSSSSCERFLGEARRQRRIFFATSAVAVVFDRCARCDKRYSFTATSRSATRAVSPRAFAKPSTTACSSFVNFPSAHARSRLVFEKEQAHRFGRQRRRQLLARDRSTASKLGQSRRLPPTSAQKEATSAASRSCTPSLFATANSPRAIASPAPRRARPPEKSS